MWTVLIVISVCPVAGSGWIVGAGFGIVLYFIAASGEGKPELNSSDFETSLFLDISYGITAETKCKIYTNE